jgi:hypothetical protein
MTFNLFLHPKLNVMCNEAFPTSPKNVFPPQKLTPAEIDNPHQVIYELFDFAHLPRIRELLWEFSKQQLPATIRMIYIDGNANCW